MPLNAARVKAPTSDDAIGSFHDIVKDCAGLPLRIMLVAKFVSSLSSRYNEEDKDFA